MTASVTWQIQPALSAKFRGGGPGDLDFPETTALIEGNEMTITDVECLTAFANQVGFFDPMSIHWEVSFDGGNTWHDAGTSKNQLYVTLDDPLEGATLYHTLVHVGCHGAAAVGADTASECVAGIWSEFSDREVERVDEQPLFYYYLGVKGASTSAGLLDTLNGDCQGWSELFMDMLAVHGISATLYEVTPIVSGAQGMFIKNWTYTGSGVSQGTYPFVYVWTQDVIDAEGLAGQGINPDPPSQFTNHFVVGYSGQYYDPSYGGVPFATHADWENASLAGLCRDGTYNGLPARLVSKNLEQIVETAFTEQ